MFDPPQRVAAKGTIDQALARRRDARLGEVRDICSQKARLDQRLTVLSREAGDDGDWKDAGCRSGTEWLAQVTHSDYRTAAQIADAGAALRDLPALDALLSNGTLTLDQATAATPFATPETDAQIARLAVGKAPRAIARLSRALAPPVIVDDAALRERRALTMDWIEGGRALVLKGMLPLEQGVVFEQTIRSLAKAQRAADTKSGQAPLRWQQYTADALLALATDSGEGRGGDACCTDGGGGKRVARVKRSNATVILHLSADEPPFLEGGGTVSPETAEWIACDARRVTIKRHGRDLLHSRAERCATYAQMRALVKRSKHCQYPGCTSIHELQAHHIIPYEICRETLVENLLLVCTRHHKLLHDRHIHTSGTGEAPIFATQAGRAINANQPHAPPR